VPTKIKEMKCYSILVILCFITSLYAQQDSILLTDHSDTIVLEKSRLPAFGLGHNTTHLGEAVLKNYRTRNLAQVLQLESTFFVKNYFFFAFVTRFLGAAFAFALGLAFVFAGAF